ncbi:malate dehydrogenase [Poseidonibacter lekithochrous]|uniref:malate dehydrogenase n=1 Tax=Poseidonibacter lekithochrous TaxID=1904463 RepID=UPI000D3D7767|nr:malate dehydrogenase [Poseidonibacter lekithochrous]
MAKKKQSLVDLKKLNLSFEEKNQIIKLINLKTKTLTLDTEIYENDQFIAKREMVYAHLPKKLKAQLNSFF